MIQNEIIDGYLITSPDACKQCKKFDCVKGTKKVLAMCSYGFNYYPLENCTLIGFINDKYQTTSKARNKNIKKNKDNILSSVMFDKIISSMADFIEESDSLIESIRKDLVQEFGAEKQFEAAFLEDVQLNIEKAFSNLHDYKQVLVQVLQNINVIIEQKYTGRNFDEKLEQANDEEKTIYYATKIMDDKLETTKLIKNPSLLNDKQKYKNSRFHGVVYKYTKIYQKKVKAKNIELNFIGESIHQINCHPIAISSFPQTFIDNAIKYSPYDSEIKILIKDLENKVSFAIISYGPKIEPDEREAIFRPFVRGKAAINASEEGSGYGLYLCQFIAKTHFNTMIEVEQNAEPNNKGYYLTTFKVLIPLNCV